MKLSDVNLNALFVFTVLARTGSVAAAARELGTQKSTVSRQLAQLEEQLGARLVHRTSRTWALTEAGQRFEQECQAVVEAARAALVTVQPSGGEPTGLLRISAPVMFGQSFLSPVVAAFLQRHAQVRVSVSLTDRPVDLVDEGIDIAIRIGPIADSTLIMRRIATLDPTCCASPAYLAEHGTPETPQALAAHHCLAWNDREPTATWRFRGPTGHVQVPVTGRASADNPVLHLNWALAGLGIALLPRFLARAALAEGQLIELFPGSPLAFAGVVALYPSGQLLAPKVRAFVDLLAASFAGPRSELGAADQVA